MEKTLPQDRRVALGALDKENSATIRMKKSQEVCSPPNCHGSPDELRIKTPSETRRSREEAPSPEENTSGRGWYSRGYLPHFDQPGLIQHITFHLGDSLPQEAVERMQRQIESLPEERQALERRKRIMELLDQGMGSCVLRRDECARIVEDSLRFGDGSRYRLIAWVIMPNHVHVLIETVAEWPLDKVVQSWKRHTSRQIHLLAAQGVSWPPGPLWYREYWDRYIRDTQHFATVAHYIENNPVEAGLVLKPDQWPWGSARHREAPSGTRRSQGMGKGDR